jgi:hypothetical protein
MEAGIPTGKHWQFSRDDEVVNDGACVHSATVNFETKDRED